MHWYPAHACRVASHGFGYHLPLLLSIVLGFAFHLPPFAEGCFSFLRQLSTLVHASWQPLRQVLGRTTPLAHAALLLPQALHAPKQRARPAMQDYATFSTDEDTHAERGIHALNACQAKQRLPNTWRIMLGALATLAFVSLLTGTSEDKPAAQHLRQQTSSPPREGFSERQHRPVDESRALHQLPRTTKPHHRRHRRPRAKHTQPHPLPCKKNSEHQAPHLLA